MWFLYKHILIILYLSDFVLLFKNLKTYFKFLTSHMRVRVEKCCCFIRISKTQAWENQWRKYILFLGSNMWNQQIPHNHRWESNRRWISTAFTTADLSNAFVTAKPQSAYQAPARTPNIRIYSKMTTQKQTKDVTNSWRFESVIYINV